MRENTRRCHTVVLPTLLLAVMLLGACGNSNKKSTSPASAPGQSVAVGLSTCTTCHAGIAADWLTSRHANAEGGLDSAGTPTLGQIANCTTNCHDPNGDSNNLAAGHLGNVPRPVIGCETCHGPGSVHASLGGTGPISLLANATGTSLGSVAVSGQYVMCTSCHELLNTAGTGTVAATHDPNSSVTPTGLQYTITDTHFATPGDWSGGQNSNDISGYAMNFAADRVCVNCHNPHKPADINREWAQSLHADKAMLAAWAHYNWSCDTANCGATGSRTACQRCHTTSGFAAFANALRTGDMAAAGSIAAGIASPAPVAYSSGFKPEMLECTGCHTDNRGTLRNSGAYTADYSYLSAVASYAYPDASSSNVCLLCHTARMSGNTIKNLVLSNPTTSTFGNLSFVDSHYLAAGGVMYTAVGYEFGRSYANPASYKHDKIGTAAASNTGSGGPCVGCHMYRTGASASHLFRAVGKDSNDVITSVVSEVCYNCHAGSSSSLADVVEKEKIEFEEALAALIHQLDMKGISFNNAYPYMYKQRYTAGSVVVTASSTTVTGIGTLWSSASITTTDFFRASVDDTAYPIASVVDDTTMTLASVYTGTTSTTSYVIMMGTRLDGVKNWLFGGTEDDGRNTMGTAFNLQILEHEPGAYVHNSKYVKRLIYDSIDWLDNGVLDYSVGATLNALPSDAQYKNGSMTYLLPNGIMTGVDMERP